MNIPRSFVTLVIAALFSGCSTTLPVNYIPSATMRGSGDISPGTFRYIPAEKRLVAPNQFQSADFAIGEIYTSEPVTALIRNAVRKELVAAGFSTEPGAPLTINGEITKFLYDWIGYVEVDFYLDITFHVLRNGNEIMVYNASSHQSAPKTMTQDTEAVRAAISKCIDDFFLEARSKKTF